MYRNLEAINSRFREQREMQREIEETVSFIINIEGKKICCYRTEKTAKQTKLQSSVGLWGFLELRGFVGSFALLISVSFCFFTYIYNLFDRQPVFTLNYSKLNEGSGSNFYSFNGLDLGGYHAHQKKRGYGRMNKDLDTEKKKIVGFFFFNQNFLNIIEFIKDIC